MILQLTFNGQLDVYLLSNGDAIWVESKLKLAPCSLDVRCLFPDASAILPYSEALLATVVDFV